MSEILRIVESIKSSKTTARAEVEAAIKRAEDDKTNAILEVIRERALERADEIDAKIKAGEEVGRLAGVPFVAKDNFLTYDSKTTAASKILENFEAPVQATAIEKLEAEGAICVGKANLDSFAHGGSTENSAFGVTKNAVDEERVAGGSSGGSAVAVAKGVVPFALGSDTGGSIRQPASFNGVVGYKPSYGMISRYGVVAMASSTDVVGPIAKSVEDVQILCEILAGQDGKDSTVFTDYFSNAVNQHAVQIYDLIAEDYAKTFDVIDDEKELVFLNTYLKNLKPKSTILDLGCGTGWSCGYFVENGMIAEGVDLSKNMIKIAKRNFSDIKFHEADVREYEPQKKVDSVWAGYSLSHFDQVDFEKTVSNVNKFINDDGVFGLVMQLGEGGKTIKEPFLENEKIYYHLYTEKQLKEILKKYGFEIIDTAIKKAKIVHETDFDKILVLAKKINDVDTKKPKIGLIKQFIEDGVDKSVRDKTFEFVKKLRNDGYEVEEVDLPMAKYALPIYYIVTPAEISSNLARFDGIRYGLSSDKAKDLTEVYAKSRQEGFVDETKRRVMIGAYVLSSGFFDAYYLQAQKARTLLIGEFNKLFEEYDFLIGPVAPTPAYKIGENIDDPLKMYMSDIMTCPASLAGLPALSLPIGVDEKDLPIGIQIIGQMKSDSELLSFAKGCEK